MKRLHKFSFLTISILVSAFSAGPVFAIEYGGLGGRPAYPREDNERSSSIFIHTAEPGSEIEEGVVVMNNTNEEKTLLVYAADSTPSTGGGFACKQLLEEQIEVGTWITLEKQEVTLAAHANELVPFTIEIPNNASVGEHNGCILIQEKPQDSQGVDSGAGIHLSLRTGLRVALTIPGNLNSSLSLAGFSSRQKGFGATLYEVAIQNTGNVSSDADISLITKNLLGKTIHEEQGSYPVLRGENAELNFQLPSRFWGGVYSATLNVSYQQLHDSMVTGKTKHLNEQRLIVFVLPEIWGLIVEALFIFVISLLTVMLARRRDHRKHLQTTWKKHKLGKDFDIEKVARHYGVSWKQIAKANKLKAPFHLRKGDVILLPPKRSN